MARRASGGAGAYLDGLLRVLLVGDRRVVVVHGAVEGLGGLVLVLDGLVERVLRLVGGLWTGDGERGRAGTGEGKARWPAVRVNRNGMDTP